MITYEIKAGSTDISVVCRAVDSTDGTPETAFDHATSGIDLKYRREGAANVDITEAALADLTTAHTDGGVEQIGNGYFRLDLPDAAVAAGVSGVLVHGVATGMVIIGCYIRLVANNAEDVYTRIGAPAGASVSADIAAIEAQTDDIGVAGAGLTAVPWNAAWDAEVQSEVQDAIEANNLDHLVGSATAIPAVPAGTYLDQLMDDGTAAYDRTTDSLQAIRDHATTIKTETASIQADTDNIQTRIPAALVSGRMDASVGAMAPGVLTATAIGADAFTAAKFAADVTTEFQSGLATAAALATVGGIVDDIKQMLGHKTTIATLASQTSFTLTAGSANDNAYNGWGAYVVDQSTATQIALGVVSDYTGSTKTVTLTEDPAIFTMATGDTIILLPGKLTDTVLADLRKVMGNAFTGSTKPYDTTA